MKIELCISRDRVPYIVKEIGTNRVVVSDYKEGIDLVAFETDSQMDLLHMFHAGIRCGSDNMAKTLCKQVV